MQPKGKFTFVELLLTKETSIKMKSASCLWTDAQIYYQMYKVFQMHRNIIIIFHRIRILIFINYTLYIIQTIAIMHSVLSSNKYFMKYLSLNYGDITLYPRSVGYNNLWNKQAVEFWNRSPRVWVQFTIIVGTFNYDKNLSQWPTL